MMHELNEYIAAALSKPLPAQVMEMVQRHIFDTLAALVAGANLKAGGLALEFMRA